MNITRMLILLIVVLVIALAVAINTGHKLSVKDERNKEEIERLLTENEALQINNEFLKATVRENKAKLAIQDSLIKTSKDNEKDIVEKYDDLIDNVSDASWEYKRNILTRRGWEVKED